MAEDKLEFYYSWYCPFAQRVWIALLEKGLEFTGKEVDPFKKTPEFLAINPRGFVPVLLHNGRSIYESLVCVQYIDEAFPMVPRLLPEDPYRRAQVRIWCDFIDKNIVPAFYKTLQSQDMASQKKAANQLLQHLEHFSKAMSPGGPFFLGPEFSMVDIALLPFSLRLFLLKHFRGVEVPQGGDYARFHKWLEACHSRSSVVPTVAEEAKMLTKYETFANDTSESKFAQAIRTGDVLP